MEPKLGRILAFFGPYCKAELRSARPCDLRDSTCPEASWLGPYLS